MHPYYICMYGQFSVQVVIGFMALRLAQFHRDA